MTLSRKEVESITDYLFMHVRSTNGTARNVYEKMVDFLDEKQPSLLDIAQQVSVE